MPALNAPVAKSNVKFPLPSIAGDCVTPLTVIDTLPVGISKPFLIVPESVVGVAP